MDMDYAFGQRDEATLRAERKQDLSKVQKAARKKRRLFNIGAVWSNWSNKRLVKRFINMPDDQARLDALDNLYARDGKWSPSSGPPLQEKWDDWPRRTIFRKCHT